MKIVIAAPPNYEYILNVFPSASKKGVLFCWEDTIYNPSNTFVPQSLIEHEMVHSQAQKVIGVQQWWSQYLTEKAFRFDEELRAHRRELEYVISTLSRQERRSQAVRIAERLASPLYGNMVTVKQARKLLESH